MGLPPGFTLVEDEEESTMPAGFTLVSESGPPVIRGEQTKAMRMGEESVSRPGIAAEIDSVLMKIPGVPQLAEIAAGSNRSVAATLDFLGPNNINALLQIGGSDMRMPTFAEGARDLGVPDKPGAFIGEGITADVLNAAGEVIPASVGMGAGFREVAQSLPRLGREAESTIRGMVRQMGASPNTARGIASQDAGYGALSGGGGEIGQQVGGDGGELVGATLAPLSVGGAYSGLRRLFTSSDRVRTLTSNLASLSDEGASSLLAEAMVREGISPEEIMQRMAQLGPEGVPADISNTFARLLRLSANKIPRIEGRAGQVFTRRQQGQADRLYSSLDIASGVPGLSVDDEIKRLNIAFGPEIKRLYDSARSQALPLSPRVRSMIDGDSAVGRAQPSVQRRLADRRAAGDQISNIDLIDATKQELDDQIGVALRQGQNNLVRDLIRLKNILVREADASIPEYKQAREMFSGVAQMENAADAGFQFFKLKPREVTEFVETMSASELRMFRLGAKQAILDRMETLPVSADAVKRLFGKRGDVEKLAGLFPSEEAYKEFATVMEREANFIMTRRAAQGNSTTIQQASDAGGAEAAFSIVQGITGNPVQAAQSFGRIVAGLSSKKGDEAFVQALEAAGDILLESGMEPDRLIRLIRQGDAARIKSLLENVLIKPSEVFVPTLRGAAAFTLTPDQ
jgi:hypothetical protein